MARAIIGIAGYMGAGKSTVGRLLAARRPGAFLIDADHEAKALMAADRTIAGQLAAAFGGSIIKAGTLDFGTLGRTVFSSREKIEKLNAIVHPPLVERLCRILSVSSGRDMVLDAALLPLWRIETRFDACLWVEAPFDARLSRLKAARRDLDEASLRGRMRLQEETLPAPASPPWVRIDNAGSIDRLTGTLAVYIL
jgi:dephospho-CoA kinase